jgi:hypothetical protein
MLKIKKRKKKNQEDKRAKESNTTKIKMRRTCKT